MSKTAIAAYYPKQTKTKLVQAHIDQDLFEQIDKHRQQNSLKWPELITALFKYVLDQEKQKEKK